MMKSFVFTLLALLIGTTEALAFIPTSKTILNRTTRAHGRGAYILEQDVTIRAEGEPIVVREKWVIQHAEAMRVEVNRRGSSDNPVKLDIVYRNGKRSLFDSQGHIKTVNISPEFIEPYFFYRTPNSFLSSLQKAKVLPSNFGQMSRKITQLNEKDKSESARLISINEPYLRLSRSAGVVNYAFGKTSDHSESPGIWIEQDAFVIRRIKFPSLAEVQADQYQTYPNGLSFPRERTLKWGSYSATARVVSIRAASAQEVNKGLTLGKSGEESASRVPEIAGLKEFYSRFR